MPDAPLPPGPETLDPGPQGTALWNLQTQKPEFVPFADVKTKLSSGAYRAYEGSQTSVAAGIGTEAGLDPLQAAVQVAGKAVPTHTEVFRNLEARKKEYAAQYDNAGDKALAFVDGTVSGLSGDLLDGLPSLSAMGKLEREKRGEENSGYKTLGELAALVATIYAPESALKYTPLGLDNILFGKAAKGAESALGAIKSPLLKRGVSEAVGGATAAAALSTAHQVQQAVQGKPVSGFAVVDDVGLGALVGFGFGAVGHGLSTAAGKQGKIAEQIQAAAEFDKSAAPIQGVLSDVSKSWHSAHNVAGARVEALDDLVKSGMLDGDLPGTEWLKARTEAKSAADTARNKLQKLAGTDDPATIGNRLHELAVSGKAKEAQKLYSAFDEYGTAVSHLDDVMQPTTFDTAHLHDVIGDIDLAMPAKDHPMQRLEQMINNGTPTEEIEAFAKQIDDAYRAERKQPSKDLAGAETIDKPLAGTKGPEETTGRKTEAASPGSGNKGTRQARELVDMGVHDSTFQPPKFEPPEARTGQQPRDFVTEGRVIRHEPLPVGPGVEAPHMGSPAPNEDLAISNLLGGSRAGNETAGFQAKKILDQARVEKLTGVMSPVRPTELGGKIQFLLDQLTAATGNRLGSAEARQLAGSLGMNVSSMNGPVSQKLADLWALHRMSEHLAGVSTKGGPRSKESILTKALSWGAVSGSGAIGAGIAGPVGGGAARSLARHFLGTALYGASALAATAGRFRQSALNGMAKALSPAGRRLGSMAAVYGSVSASYEPNKPPTTDYKTKADQLRRFEANPEPMSKHIKDSFRGLGAVDPQAFVSAHEAAMTRLKNLAGALPQSTALTMMIKHKGPTEGQLADFHAYEAVTTNKELIYKYLKAGYMPQTVISAMNEQHPDYMTEIRDYVLNNPDEVQSAPHDTQLALSRLLGVPIIPEADPQYVKRMQEPYIEAKQKASQTQMQNQGAQALKAGPPTAAQILVLPR